ncbi:MAG: cytochrome P450 [Pseudomonadales bacterium]|nr:cytochrome P450 [Pseudomonadales bacterium]
MTRPPDLRSDQLEPVSLDSPVDPSFLGFTPLSWLKLIKEQGPVFKSEYRGEEAYIIGTHEADRIMWKSPDDWLYGPPSSGGDFFREVMGDMHVTQLDGEPHRRSRRLILPAFGVAAVTRAMPAVNEVIAKGLAQLAKGPMDFHPDLSRLIARALNVSQVREFPSDEFIDKMMMFEEAFIPASALPDERRKAWYQRADYVAAREAAFSYFKGIVNDRLAGKVRGDSLDLVIEKAAPEGLSPLSREELVRATYLLSIAGVGNIANILCAALWAIRGTWFERLRVELEGFDANDLKSGMSKFPVLGAVISETERCFLPAPVIPKLSAHPMNFMGYDIPGHVHVLHLHGLAHFEEERYAEAGRFDPSRWLMDDKAERANAFGGGPHLCLGMGIARFYVPLTLAHIVKDYDWHLKGPPVYVSQAEDFEGAPLTTRCLGSLEPRSRG